MDQNGHADSGAAEAHDDQPEAMENGVDAADDDDDDGVTSFGKKKKKKTSKSKRGEPKAACSHPFDSSFEFHRLSSDDRAASVR